MPLFYFYLHADTWFYFIQFIPEIVLWDQHPCFWTDFCSNSMYHREYIDMIISSHLQWTEILRKYHRLSSILKIVPDPYIKKYNPAPKLLWTRFVGSLKPAPDNHPLSLKTALPVHVFYYMYIFFARTINPSQHNLAIIVVLLHSLQYQSKHSPNPFANLSASPIQTKNTPLI